MRLRHLHKKHIKNKKKTQFLIKLMSNAEIKEKKCVKKLQKKADVNLGKYFILVTQVMRHE
jgi:hypothetical protein